MKLPQFTSTGSPPTIINIDDDEASLYVKSRLLRSFGYRVIEGSTGSDALRLAREHKPQLALVDVKLPDITGIEVCKVLKSDIDTRAIMVLLVSAFAVQREDKVAGLEEGADAYLVEPAHPDEMIAMVRALLRLYRQEEIMSTQARLLDLSNDAIILRDEQDRIMYWNHGARLLYGWRSEETIGKTSHELLQSEYPTSIEDIRATLEREGCWSGEVAQITRDGKRVLVDSRCSQERDVYGNPGAILEINSDITERKRGEEALRTSEAQLRTFAQRQEQLVKERTKDLMQSQTRLRALAMKLSLAEQHERQRLAGELHDYLKQLLALIRIKLDMAIQHPMDSSLAKLITDAHDMTDKSLDYTRTLVSQLYPPTLKQFGLPAALQWLVEQLRQRNFVVSLQMNTQVQSLPEDKARLLFQSVRELLFNCMKHAQVPEATVVLQESNDFLHITISDKGMGFDPSSAIPGVETGKGSFGLYSIHERMISLGGHFDLTSAPGKGTKVRLVLPLTNDFSDPLSQDGEGSILSPGNTANKDQPSCRRLRVMVADDHAMVRQGLCTMLAGYGDLEVVGEAANGEEAVEMGNRLQPDVLLMDVTMTRLDGVEATRRIKQQHPSIIVIGLSVHDSNKVKEAMKHAGADAFIDKGATVDRLYETIHDLGVMPHTIASL